MIPSPLFLYVNMQVCKNDSLAIPHKVVTECMLDYATVPRPVVF